MTKLEKMKSSLGKRVLIEDIDGKTYRGFVQFIEDADENDMNEFVICVRHGEDGFDGFYESDIVSIEFENPE